MTKNYFDEMLKHINENNITFEKFNIYFIHLITAIKNGYLKGENLKYLTGLYNASVLFNNLSSDDEKYYKLLIEIINQLIIRETKSIMTSTDKSRISLYIARIELLSSNYNKLSVNTYVEYCELFKLMYEMNIEGVNYVKLANSLLHAHVNVNLPDDREIVDSYKRELSILLEEIKKRTLK